MTRSPHTTVCLMLVFAFMFGCEAGYDTELSNPEEASMEAKSGALLASAQAEGAKANNEGVNHYQQGHWDVAQQHFQEAVATNADLAEAHYNLALTLDKLGNHGEATNHFQMALDRAPNNPSIKDSGILKAHLGG